MSRPRSKVPQLRYHISGQSVVSIDGKDFYLGKHESAESVVKHAVLISAYQSGGLKLPDGFDQETLYLRAKALETMPNELVASHQASLPILVKHVTASYRVHLKKTYANSKADLARRLGICNDIDNHDGSLQAKAYGPKALQRQRDRWVDSGKSRNYCNTLTNNAVRMFRFAVGEELVDSSVWERLKSIEPLREGQTEAPETSPVRPVALADVRATAKELPPVLKAMVRIQVATGMRPSELCGMRPGDIDRAGTEWMYRPPHHKNKRKGKSRAIPILGDAKEALIDYMNRHPEAFCFSPSESVAWQNANKRANRQTKVQPSQLDRSKENPEVQAGDAYTPTSYRRAITRAATRAKVSPWFPYQLRHLNLTEIRDSLGVEHAQAMGGHSRIDMTEVYAKVSEAKAIEAAKHAPTL